MPSKHSLSLTFLVSILSTISFVSQVGAKDIDFQREIRPILSDKCYTCHGPDEEVREADLRLDTSEGAFADLGGNSSAIVAGHPSKSLLVERIFSTDADEVMPPADHPRQLTDEEKQLLVQWIEQGAKWQEHWAYSKLVKYTAPKKYHEAADNNFVDSFVRKQLSSSSLALSDPADKRTLMRRLHFDLIGLPPSADELQSFLDDDSPQAFEKVVDRLLASDHYGERMAIYWLDLVRYADTVGYHGDQDVSISPYRDYVIQSFNENLPFDRFTREQLAGDLLEAPTQEQLIASGYNRLGMMSAEGGVQPKEYLAKYIADRVRNLGSVWLGSTIGCAECHDHKYDPYTMKDFYNFAAFFADIKEKGLYSGAHATGAWGPKMNVPDDQYAALAAPLDKKLVQLQSRLDTQTYEDDVELSVWESKFNASSSTWQVLKPSKATALHETTLQINADGSVLAKGKTGKTNRYTLRSSAKTKNINALRIDVMPDKSLPKQGPGRAPNGNFVLTELRVSIDRGDGTELENVVLQNATATIEQTHAGTDHPYGKWTASSVIDKDEKGANWGWAVMPDIGKPNILIVELENSINLDEKSSLVIELIQNHDNHSIGKFRLSVTGAEKPIVADRSQLLPDEFQKILGVKKNDRSAEQQKKLADFFRTVTPALDQTRKSLEEAKKEKEKLVKEHTTITLVTEAVTPREIRVLARGNWMDETGEVVTGAVPKFLGGQLQATSDGESNRPTRLDLANWLVAPENPLTARVFVNRLWKLYFGRGLSGILDDVGSQGEQPSHPELLDRLAKEFVDSGWDVKKMVKLIVMSEAYRQSSLPNQTAVKNDPYNRLLSHQSRFRLEAEIIRDNALSVSGLLVKTLGGRSVKPYQPEGLYRHLNFPARKYKQDVGDNQFRRGVYTHWQRQYLHPAMKSFDAPAREECTAERPRSNTPLAALVLLNDPSYVEAARVFAENTIKTNESTDQRIDSLMQRALSRPPVDRESKVLAQLYNSQLKHYRQHQDEAKQLISLGLTTVDEDLDVAETAAWTSVARTIFNMHEFVNRN